MNFGDCPYEGCDGFLSVVPPAGLSLPAYLKLNCPECARLIWYEISRIDPKAWTEEGFMKNHVVDEVTKHVTEKGGAK